MAQAFDVETTINRSADDVWKTLTDWTRAAEWMRGIDSMTANGPNEVGTELLFRARGKDRPATIAAIDESTRSLTLRSVQGGVTADYRYRMEPVADGTARVHLAADCATTGVWSLFAPLLRLMMKRTDSGQLEDLKKLMESG